MAIYTPTYGGVPIFGLAVRIAIADDDHVRPQGE